jgi:hypothetical protein
LPEAGQSGKRAGKEYSSPATKPVIKRDCEPATDEGTAEVWRRVDQTKYPRVSVAILVTDTELFAIEDLCSIDNGLILNIVSTISHDT